MGKGGASKVEKYSSALQAQAAQKQAALAEKQYAWWEKLFAPQEEKMMKQLGKPVTSQSYFKQLMGDVEKQFGDIRGQTRRTLAGRYQYGAGAETASSRNLALSKASARAGAWGQAEALRQNQLMSMFNLGRGSMTSGMSGLGSAGQLAGSAAERLGSLRAQKMAGITSGFSGTCCFIFYEGHGELREDIKEARDQMFSEDSRVSYGYRVMANWLVPLMHKHTWVKKTVQKIMLDPIAEAIKRANAKQHNFPYNIIGWSWVLIWYLISYLPGAPMTWEQYQQVQKARA